VPALSTLDTFTDSDKALASHTPDHPDYTWTTHASFGGASALYGNRAVPANGESVAYLSLAVPDRSTENWGVEGPVYYAAAQSGSYGGLFAGTTGAKTGYVVYWYGGTWALGKYVAGTWTALGTYSESFSTGTSKVVRMRFTSTQVIVSIDGTDRITATDSSITPTRMGIYGDRAITIADATGFHISDISLVGRAILNPAREADAAQSLTFVPVGSITCNEYGEALLSLSRLTGSVTLERGPDGSTWTNVTASSFVNMSSGSNRTITDRRPQYGAGSVGYGDTIHYRVTDGASNVLTFSVTADVDKAAVRSASYQGASTFMAGTYVASQTGAQYPGDFLMTSALAYLESVDAGSPNSTYLSDTLNQFAYIQTLDNAYDQIKFPGDSQVERVHRDRTIFHVAVAARLLRAAGQSAYAASLVAQADTWAQATLGHFDSLNISGVLANSQTAWAAATSYPAGAIVRPTSANGRTYRAMNAGTSHASTQPTWPTTQGGEVTDNGITWRETGYSGEATGYYFNDDGTPYSVASMDTNQNAQLAVAFAMLCTDPDSAFYSAGSDRTAALAHLDDTIGLIATQQTSDGAIIKADNAQAKDTLYGAYTLELLCVIEHVLPGRSDVLPLLIDRAYNWLETGYSTEPIVPNRGTGTETYSDLNIAELLWRADAAKLLGTTSTVDKLPYTAAWWDPSARYGPYEPNGGVTPYGSIYQALWESEAIFQGVLSRIDLTPATETDTAVALSYGRAFSITPATETDAAQTLTIAQPQTVTLTPATEADAAVGLSWAIGGQHVSITPAAESDEAMALSFGFAVPQEVTLTPATESDAAVTLRITRSGSFAMNMQMAPGTVVGAYLRHEWIGSEVPVRGTGSYPGVAVTTATVDDYGEVEFTGLDVGSYIAWAEDYPLRRRFFVMTG